MESATKPDTSAYLKSWAQELESRAQRVRNLIGEAHWVSDGSHKEALLREFLRRYLSSGLVISKGFVRSPSAEENNCSPEIDILVADPSAQTPFFAEGDLQIVPPTSVVAHVEVKTTFESNSLNSALENIYKTQLVISKNAKASRVWRCICFYSIPPSRTPISTIATIENSIRLLFSNSRPLSVDDIRWACLPTCIATVSSYLVFLKPDGNNFLQLRLFELGSLSLACALADLFSSARRWSGGSVVGELDDLIDDLDIPAPIMHTIAF